MDPVDAAGFALLQIRDRRLVTTLLRSISERAAADDPDPLPPRERDEPLLAWACRCRAHRRRPHPSDHLEQLTREAGAQLDRASRLGLLPIPFGDARYPPLLAAIADPPPMLWFRGQAAACFAPTVALVGSRAATPYGLAMARRLSSDLAAAGLVIVSGLARGIDAAAHLAAVQAGGCTVGVLGCGVDRMYPPEHAALATDMSRNGAVVSEWPLGVPPRAHHFPLRNRVISGLSLAVVVVEAPERSGALITASAAAEQGRDVMVVPGPVTGGRNRGGHLLIRDGAKVVETADDILEELGSSWAPVAGGPGLTDALSGNEALLPEAAEFTVEEAAASSGRTPQEVLAKLLELELAGRIQRVGGGRFVRMLT